MKNTLKYVALLRLDTSSVGYKVLNVSIHRTTEHSDYELLSVRLQSDASSVRWYGNEVTMRFDRDHAERTAEASRILKRHPVTHDPRQWLADIGAPIYVRDGRVRPGLVPADRVLPARYGRWQAMDRQGRCAWDCVADGEEHATSILAKAAGAYISGAWSSEEALANVAAWEAAGRPVQESRFDKAPAVPQDDWLTPLALMEQPGPVAA